MSSTVATVPHSGVGATLRPVPTTRRRHVVTETDEVARALDRAARRWPQESSRARLLVRLALHGDREVAAESESVLEQRLAAALRHHGALSDVYEPGYLEELRRDWPA